MFKNSYSMVSENFKLTENISVKVLWFILALVLLSALFVWPLLVIWSLNTLFPVLAISYSVWTYLAVMILNLTYVTRSSQK